MQTAPSILVIGGGAAGMAAAITASREGADVILIDKEARIGRKLLATGNGRCNYTNEFAESHHWHGQTASFAKGALQRYDSSRIVSFFEELGIPPRVEDEGRVYPYSGQSASVLNALRFELERLAVPTYTGLGVQAIVCTNKGFGVQLSSQTSLEPARVILCTGGQASPQLGSDGSGYRLAAGLGHRLVEPFPALVQLTLDFAHRQALRGVKWLGTASVAVDGRTLREEAGELLFTDYGISGPPILQLSRLFGASRPKPATLHLCLFPGWSRSDLQVELFTQFSRWQEKPAELCLQGLLPKPLVQVLLKETGILPIGQPAARVRPPQIENLIDLCLDWPLSISGTLPWKHAQVTAGGLDCSQFHPKTMESRLIPGLYAAGEVLDVDGDCGGFNLQWAWASGMAAGAHAAASCR